MRLHDDRKAAASARDVGARAYTVGRHVVLGSGEHRPADDTGRRLLAHEFTHVIQQGAAAGPALTSASAERQPELESQAHRFADLSTASPAELTRGTAPALMRWDSPEHVALGERLAGGPGPLITLDCHDRDFPERGDANQWPATWRALIAVGSPEQQRAVTVGLTYGEVIALSGDFYESFGRLNTAPLSEIYRLIPLIRHGGSTGALQAATGGRYLHLAERNVAHFSNVPPGQRNLDIWRGMHSDAVSLARRASSDPRLANQAWGLNATADHYLTDAFSGGHIRTARAELLKQSTMGNVESKILHDLDNRYGVEVTNDRGDKPWVAYGDLRLDAPENFVNLARALEAVELSKRDIAEAISKGSAYPAPQPGTVFAAERLVPRPVDPSRDRWTGRVPTYVPTRAGPVRAEDDYTRMRRSVILEEAPDVIRGKVWGDDDDVRDWVNGTELAVIGRQPVQEKIRMIDLLLGGFFSWISDDDVAAIERICRSVGSAAELAVIRDRFYGELPSRMTSIGQRTRVRLALTRL